MRQPRAFVYVDAWNLFYGALSKTPFKWLDVALLAEQMLPEYDVRCIRYYSAILDPRPGQEYKVERQRTYLRALEARSEGARSQGARSQEARAPLVIQYGRFRTHTTRLPLAEPEPGGPTTAEVLKTEEKLTDVNLAVHMVHDAHLGRFDAAVLVSNDSDLAEPLSIVRHELDLEVGVLCPHLHAADDLERHARFVRPIRHKHLRAAQLPDVVLGGAESEGPVEIRKPEGW